MMITMTPAERLALVAKARAEYERTQVDAETARTRLMTQIAKALAEGAALPEERKRELGPSAIGRASGFTREYISQIRDGRKKQ